ncbi:hypothetical protein [Candidatus Synechococcus spongiarum]|uniref:hypothetical protein n=1 Tax=Candidatus Synechococcus spongiarum TaxID=431041 RepID=UPI0012682ED1|nr:hypothetical protein [Candidatus Synechococcus spongiarum]
MDENKVLKRQPSCAPVDLCRVDAPSADGPHKNLCNRFHCWSAKASFTLIFSELARSDGTETEVLLMDATDLNMHLHQKGGNEQQATCGV